MTFALSVLTAAVVAAGVPDGLQRHGPTHVLTERVQCSQSRPKGCILLAARRWRVPYSLLLRVGLCESRLRWWARNPSGASGLFQFMPGTWQTTPPALYLVGQVVCDGRRVDARSRARSRMGLPVTRDSRPSPR